MSKFNTAKNEKIFMECAQNRRRTSSSMGEQSSGLENSTHPLIFTSALGCRASENFDISSENQFFPIYGNNICDAGQVPILRYFEA